MTDHHDPIGEQVEDVVEQIVSDASPSESTETDGGTENADRDGHEAIDDDDSYTA